VAFNKKGGMPMDRLREERKEAIKNLSEGELQRMRFDHSTNKGPRRITQLSKGGGGLSRTALGGKDLPQEDGKCVNYFTHRPAAENTMPL
jgi:hypothetical protein